MMLGMGSGSTDSWAPGANLGVALPPGFVDQPFNCPPGSDFTASQKLGMCVDAASNPVYSQSSATGKSMYYALDGSAWEVDPMPAKSTDWLPGIPNIAVIGALGLLLVLKMSR